MVKLYIADISRLDIEHALSMVTDYRRKKALRCPSDEGKRQSLGAELLLYRAMNSGKPFAYRLGENGKPYLEDGRFFSLAHSGSYAVCAVADSEVGVDIELPREGALKLALRFFTENEYRRIAESSEPNELFCEYWVIKESYIKATGDGLRTPLRSFEAAEKISDYRTAHFCRDGYHIWLCVKCDEIGEIEINEVTF